nr:hypothetical protein CFP56_70390 [Quercus suber]
MASNLGEKTPPVVVGFNETKSVSAVIRSRRHVNGCGFSGSRLREISSAMSAFSHQGKWRVELYPIDETRMTSMLRRQTRQNHHDPPRPSYALTARHHYGLFCIIPGSHRIRRRSSKITKQRIDI